MANIRKLAGIVSPRWREPSTCEACGNAFTCGATLAGCWCTEVEVSERLRAQLRERYQHCLCRPCLERFAEADRADARQA
ncbi:MAG TPA: cysteine-rich CWC family protein [Pyrinomonadaceae bacterium]|nr:cysteine-rich CWC family protein [Pyrinomonadaceae bacterium]